MQKKNRLSDLNLSHIMLKKIPGVDNAIISKIHKQCTIIFKKFRQNPNDRRIESMKRYMAMEEHYDIDFDFVQHIIQTIIPPAAESFLDLGCASGDLLKIIQKNKPNAICKGIDLNPKFIIHAQTKSLDADVGMIDDIMDENTTYDCVITNLTLDRVAYPKILIQNVISSTKKNGTFIIGTLLPIESNDRKFTKGKVIEYTEKDEQITSGKSAESDKQEVIDYFRNEFSINVSIEKYPYKQGKKLIGSYYIIYGTK